MRTASGLMLLVAALGAASAATLPPVIRGSSLVYLQAPAGPLQLKVYKRDLNIYAGPDTLQAVLYDREGQTLISLDLPDDGNEGAGRAATELQSAEGRADLAAGGVYRLQILCPSGDVVYGLQTSATGCVLRGNAMLNDGSIAGRLYFRPPAEKFKITAQALHDPGRQQLPLLDGAGKVLKTFDLSKQGVDQGLEVAPDQGNRDKLWHFDSEHLDLKLLFDKPVYWTLDSTAWFDAERTRWLLLPYRQARYLPTRGEAVLSFELRNSFGPQTRFNLQVQAPEGFACRVLEPASPVQMAPKGYTVVKVTVRDEKGWPNGHVGRGVLSAVATDDPSVAQGVGFELRSGPDPYATGPVPTPIVLKRYEHENVQFGYAPDFAPNEVYFDAANHPYMRERTESMYGSAGVQVLDNGHWVLRGFLDTIKQAYPNYSTSYGGGGFLGAKVAFDGSGGAYTLLRLSQKGADAQSVLLYTPDAGKTWSLAPVPGGAFDIEQFVGHNALRQPPPVLAYVFVKSHPATFAAYNDLLLFRPQVKDGKLKLGEAIKVAENCIGSCQHSGGPASTATRDGKTHLVWGEVAPDDAPGVPEYIATYDQATGTVGEKVLLGYAPPVNDVHNVPAVCQDSQGYIHVILGAHGQPFQYTRSLKPNDAYSGWTKPVPVLTRDWVDKDNPAPGKGGQTYASLVCGPDDTLYIAYRQWRAGVDPYHNGQLFAALSVQRKPKDGPWGPAQPVVIPAAAGYSIYYHKLTIDRRGRLFLSYSYWTSDTTYQDDFPERYHNRALLMSADGAKTWKLATTADFATGIER